MKFIKTFEGSQNTDLFNDIKEIEYILKDEGIEFLDYFESNSGPSVSLWGSRSISIYIRVPFYQRSDFSTEKNFRKGLKNEILGGSYFSEYLDRIYEMYCQNTKKDVSRISISVNENPAFMLDQNGITNLFK